MAQFTPALLDGSRAGTAFGVAEDPVLVSAAVRTDIRLTVHEDLGAIEQDWREFERRADGTVFQTYEWLATWQRHVGVCRGTRPAVVIARDAGGEILMLMPLSVERRLFVRHLTWLGRELCDYNAPLLAKDFSLYVSLARFRQIWRDVLARLRSQPRWAYDLVDLEQMPETVGDQRNPMLHLGAALHRNCAFLVSLADSWEKLYAKRSSATRRHDRSKRSKLAEHGAVRFVDVTEPAEIARTIGTLMAQKGQWFAEVGVENMFAKPGVREFFHDVASHPGTRAITHVSRLEVGGAIVATGFGLMFGDRYNHVLASYDRYSELARFGPGAAHLHELMRFSIGRGFRKFDLSVGNERFKAEWCDSELKLYDHIAGATPRGVCAVLPILIVRRLKGLIKGTPALWNAFRRARTRLASVKTSVRSIGL
jgi:CelD/BcsL family acetyltransferase involved in cellulose biosynthesis